MSIPTMEKMVNELTDCVENAAAEGSAELIATMNFLMYSIGIMIPQYIGAKDQPDVVPGLIQAFVDGYMKGKQIAGDTDTVEFVVRKIPL